LLCIISPSFISASESNQGQEILFARLEILVIGQQEDSK